MYTLIKKENDYFEVKIGELKVGNVFFTDGNWFMNAGQVKVIRSNRKKAVEAGIKELIKKQLTEF